MRAETRRPGGALPRAIRAGKEFEGYPEIHPDNPSIHREMQVARLVRRHRLPRQRAFVLAGLIYGEDRE